MIRYCWNEPVMDSDGKVLYNLIVKMTRGQVLDFYWPYWSRRMLDGGFDRMLINEDACIDEFQIVYWAWTEEVNVDSK